MLLTTSQKSFFDFWKWIESQDSHEFAKQCRKDDSIRGCYFFYRKDPGDFLQREVVHHRVEKYVSLLAIRENQVVLA